MPSQLRAVLIRNSKGRHLRSELRRAIDPPGSITLDKLGREIRFALRRLKHAPAFAFGVIVTLGIGIGAAIGIGTIVYGVLFRDLPYFKPDQLVSVGFHTAGIAAPGDLHSAATFVYFAQSARSFTELGAYETSDEFALTDGDAPEHVTVAMMSPSTFNLLGVHPILGALFERKDTSWVGGDHLLPVLISEGLWKRRYGGDPTIVGRRIDIDHGPRVVIGVLPRSFEFPTRSVSVWYPAALSVRRPDIADRYLRVIGRLRDGTTMQQAEAELNTLVPSLSARFPAITPELLRHSRARVSVEPLKSAIVAPVRAQLILLNVLVVVVLLIAVTNVVNLFLLRAERTRQEIAIAVALGASRPTLAQRFVVEGIVLGLASGLVAIPCALLALSTKFGFTDNEIPRLHEVSFSADSIALVIVCGALIGGMIGAIALTRSGGASVSDLLKATRGRSSRGWRRAQNGLVSAQVAIALTLLVATGLLGRSFWNLRNARIGFEASNAMTFEVSLPWNGYSSYNDLAAFHAKLMDRLGGLPGVTNVGGALHLPLTGRATLGYDMKLNPGQTEGTKAPVSAIGNLASVDYFRTMGIPLRSGRGFRSGDLRGTPAIIVSEQLARNIFGTTNVVGRIVSPPASAGWPANEFRIVGVVGDIYAGRIEDGYTPMAYLPLLRDGDGLPPDSVRVPYHARELQYVVRGTQLPSAATIQRIVGELDRRVPAARIRTLGSLVGDATARVRLTMMLIAVIGAAALFLGIIGAYSVVSYATAGRTREFGIRLALGASPRRLSSMVLGDGLMILAIGSVAGLVSALVLMKFLRSLLYEVTPTSITEFAGATVLLVALGLIATLLPARRAARTQPAAVLRGD